MRVFVLVLSSVGLVAPTLAHAESFEIHPIRDNTLFEAADGSLSSGAGAYLFAGANSQGKLRRALLAFELADSLPRDAVLDSVFLRIHVSNVNNEAERILTVHRVQSNWGEGSSDSGAGGGGAAATAGDATWIHRSYPAEMWASPGGDFDPAASAASPTTGVGFYTFSGTGLLADVRAWVSDPGSAHGWLMRGDESAPTTARRIDSRENAEEASRPTLVVHFTPRVDPIVPTSWGRIKTTFRP
jgi:hypothetical protein